MLALSYIAHYGYALSGNDRKNAQRIAKLIDQALDEWPAINGGWKRVWGPAVFALPGTKFDDSMLYVVQKTFAPDEYAVVVRGTNPISLPNWVIWDFQAKDLKLWPFYQESTQGKSESELPCLSESSYFGLNIIQSLRPPINQPKANKHCAGIKGVNQTLLDFFQQNPTAKITTTGHSLGGALSPLVALWLKQKLSVPDAEINTVTFAAPTPGNHQFVSYFSQQLGNNLIRIANDLDIVTLAWEEGLMKKMFSVYLNKLPPLLPLPPMFLMLANLYCQGRNKHYQHLEGEALVFPGDFEPLALPYVTQAIYQHVISYPKLMQMEKAIRFDSWLPCTSKLTRNFKHVML